MLRRSFFLLLIIAVVGGSLLPPSPLLVKGEHKPFYLQFLSDEGDSVCHCPTHEALKKSFRDQARRDGGRVYYMINCYGDFSQQAAAVFKDMAPMESLSFFRIPLVLSEALIPSNFHYLLLSLAPPDKPPRLS